MFEELDVEITNEELLKSIKQLRNNASGGPDLLLNEFFKNASNVLLPYLHKLFNSCLARGYFPDSWSEGHIVPIFKSGDTSDPGNYRGITLLSTLGKLFSRVLNNRLIAWAEQYEVYIEAQAGFRKGMSTTDNIFVLHGIISNTLNQGGTLYCAFVDFKKAFDFVVRDILWYKLIKLGVRGKILEVIRSMYKCIKSRVKYMNTLSSEFSCYLGVRQGECLSPFLFSMYLNDLEQEFVEKGVQGIDVGMLNLCLLLYADDIILLANSAENLTKFFKCFSRLLYKVEINS